VKFGKKIMKHGEMPVNDVDRRWYRSTNRRIFDAIITIGGFTFLVNLATTAKELVVAHQFGTSDALDAFLIAFLIPSFAINVIAGSFSAGFIPTFIEVRDQEGQEIAHRLYSSVMVLNVAMLLTISILLAGMAPLVLPILGSGFSLDKIVLTRSLYLFLLPVLIINGIGMTWAAVLNASERFALTSLSPMATPLLTIFLLTTVSKSWGIYVLAAGTVGGFVMNGGLLAWNLIRHGFPIVPDWVGMDLATKKVIRQCIPLVPATLLMGSTTLVDQGMAAMLGPGSVSALNYGNRVVTLVLGIGSISLGTAIFPHFSRMVAVKDWNGVRHTLKTYISLILLVTVPLAFGLIYFSEPLVRLLFERGAFTSSDTNLVSQVQTLFLLQVPFYLLGVLITRLISSIRANNILLWAALINLFLKIMLNYFLMHRIGVAGIALSTTLVYVVSFIFCFTLLYKRMQALR
jgi:putative peptidoglycan lipid II flippase